jgi:hypothetical protein
MKDENDSRRREILSTLGGLSLAIYLYRAPVAGRPIRASRNDCLRALIPELAALDVARLVIESCSQDHRDNQVIQPLAGELLAQGRSCGSAPLRRRTRCCGPLMRLRGPTARAGIGGDG